jgi:hypothetical protein
MQQIMRPARYAPNEYLHAKALLVAAADSTYHAKKAGISWARSKNPFRRTAWLTPLSIGKTPFCSTPNSVTTSAWCAMQPLPIARTNCFPV